MSFDFKLGHKAKTEASNILIKDFGISYCHGESKIELEGMNDGFYFATEVSTNGFIVRSDHYLYKDKVIQKLRNKNICKGIKIAERESVKTHKEMWYDFILFEIKDHELTWYKTIEINGEGHFVPSFDPNEEKALEKFVDTLYSDQIKRSNGTSFISYANTENFEHRFFRFVKKHIEERTV